ncbi:hypothetical protein AAEU32_12365 [Pseudoalteromonas sp. SSDWG2]|uniref:hypothetical protein n=1 Tax=Pseudoalteromonas sp. SSDWG2 TaxID=3139391 RepID=UPI003BAD999B
MNSSSFLRWLSCLVLLDEPDNHLDLDAQDYVAKALFEYHGGFILISHDDHFCARCGIEETINLSESERLKSK